MQVLIVRHGPAGGVAAKAAYRGRDVERPLTPEGKDKTRRAARGLAETAPRPELVATSGYRRARQTADIVARRLDVPVEETPLLEPDADPRETARWLRDRKEDVLVLVGHEPHLGKLIACLCVGTLESFTDLKKGHACLLDLGKNRRPRARLLWSLTPGQLRKIR